MRVELVDCERVLLEEIESGRFRRDAVALTYAFALSSSERVDWGKVNRAIVARWSDHALEYIKRKAWRLVEAKKAEAAA